MADQTDSAGPAATGSEEARAHRVAIGEWVIERAASDDGGVNDIRVVSPRSGPGFMTASSNSRSLSERMLHGLAAALLQHGPAPLGVEQSAAPLQSQANDAIKPKPLAPN